MDESAGVVGILVVVLLVAALLFGWQSLRERPPAEAVPPVAEAEQDVAPPPSTPAPAEADVDAGPTSGPAIPLRPVLGVLAALYAGGLFLLRPRAIQAKRNGASDAEAAYVSLVSFAFSPVVVPVFAVHRGLALLGRLLTAGTDDAPGPRKPRGANDLD